MVKATLNQPPLPKPTVALEMDWDTAEVLATVLSNVGGPTQGNRGKIDGVTEALQAVGVDWAKINPVGKTARIPHSGSVNLK